MVYELLLEHHKELTLYDFCRLYVWLGVWVIILWYNSNMYTSSKQACGSLNGLIVISWGLYGEGHCSGSSKGHNKGSSKGKA